MLDVPHERRLSKTTPKPWRQPESTKRMPTADSFSLPASDHPAYHVSPQYSLWRQG